LPAKAPAGAGPAQEVLPAGMADEGVVVQRQIGFDPTDCADFRVAAAEYEKAILAAALERCRWNQRAAATALSLTYDQLRHAMRRHELQG